MTELKRVGNPVELRRVPDASQVEAGIASWKMNFGLAFGNEFRFGVRQ
jgi:hypothetical protein